MNKKVVIGVLIVLLYFPFFIRLGHTTYRIWDESRQAVLSYEMMHSSNIFVPTYLHQPDHWNLKPPFLIWCQSLCMKIFGPGEMAVRLPSAVAGFLTSLLLLFFFWKYFDRFWLGFIAALMLCTIPGYIDDHGARSGDYDTMVTFFSTAYIFLFYLYIEHRKSKYAYLAFTAVTLAAMTKGIAGILFVPGIIFWIIFSGKIKLILRDKHFYFSMLIFLIIVPGFYLLRDHYDPGYLKLVNDNEWGGRYSSVIEGHEGEWDFYIYLIRDYFLNYWEVLIICGLVAGLIDIEKNFRKVTGFIAVNIILFAVIVSTSKTKTTWYTHEMIPSLCCIISVFIYFIFRTLQKIEIPGIVKFQFLPFVFLFIVFFRPYNGIIKSVYEVSADNWNKEYYNLGYYLRSVVKGKSSLKEPLHIVFRDSNYHLIPYVEIINETQVANQVVFNNCESLLPGNHVLCSQNDMNDCLNRTYNLEDLGSAPNYYSYRVISKK